MEQQNKKLSTVTELTNRYLIKLIHLNKYYTILLIGRNGETFCICLSLAMRQSKNV